jgi:hypothetical protein
MARQAQLDLAPVGAGRLSDYQVLGDQTVDQLYRAVVLDEQLLGQVGDGHGAVLGAAAQDKHHLIVLARQPGPGRRPLAEAQEFAQCQAHRGEPRVIARRQMKPPLGFLKLHARTPGRRFSAPPALVDNIASRYKLSIVPRYIDR